MLLLLLLPSFAFASINVSINGYIFFEDNTFKIIGSGKQKGFDQQVATEDDRVVFNIENERLRNMIEHINGKKPDEVLVRSDGNWGDIYKKQNWNVLRRKIEADVKDCNLDFKNENVVLKTTNYDNHSNRMKPVQITESQTVNNYVMSIWNGIAKGKNVNVEFKFEVENKNLAEFKKDFAIGDDRRFIVHEQFFENRTINLLPKQTVKARLEATKGTLTAVIPYKVTLSGDVVAKYNTMYKDKYFFKFDIAQLFAANQRIATITVYQIIVYEFHYDVTLHIVGADDIVLRVFTEEHGNGKNISGKRKAIAKKEFEPTDGVKLRRKSIPAEFVERIHKAVVEETVNENEESEETVA